MRVSELRWHPLLEEWVITATHRQDRTFFPPPGFCPLCPTEPGGFGSEIPYDAYAVAVFENKFPSLRPQAPDPAVEATALSPVLPAEGACEVVCYAQGHDRTFADLSVAEIATLLRVWADRTAEIGAREAIDYVYCFENKGTAIGVTLHHPHGQIYAFPFVPPRVSRTVEAASKHHAATGRCLHCDALAQELEDGRRIVDENAHAVAFVPFYARYPYEVHLYPKRHQGDLTALTPAEIRGVAELLSRVTRRYDALWGFSMPYIMAIFQAPTDGGSYPGEHWRIEFTPPMRTPEKLKYLAGCEAGAGNFINDTLPEEKAAELRAASLTELAP